jgi:serine/threonine-protein kinase
MQTCPNCGLTNSATARFCNHCGQALSGGASQAMPGTGLLPPNAVLSNRYIILRKVGQGGMGAVYQAADTRIQGKVWAVKEMSDAALTNPLEKQQAIQPRFSN